MLLLPLKNSYFAVPLKIDLFHYKPVPYCCAVSQQADSYNSIVSMPKGSLPAKTVLWKNTNVSPQGKEKKIQLFKADDSFHCFYFVYTFITTYLYINTCIL